MQVRINDANYTFGQGKSFDFSNILSIEHLFPFIATKRGNSLGRVGKFTCLKYQ